MASLKVLTSPVLLETISSFQDGVFPDISSWFGKGKMALKWRDRAIQYRFATTHFPTNRQSYANPLCLAILSGDFHVVQRIAKCKPHLVAVQSFEYALGTQNVHIAEYFIEKRGAKFEFECPGECTLRFIISVARMDNVVLFKLLHEYFAPRYEHILLGHFSFILSRRYYACASFLYALFRKKDQFPQDVVNKAADTGHLDLIIRLHNENAVFTTKAMDNAAQGGSLEVVKFLHENRNEGCTRQAMHGAAICNRLEIVKFLHFNRFEGCSSHTILGSVRRGHVRMVKFLLENRPEIFSSKALLYAIHRQMPEMTKILLDSKRFEYSQEIFDLALSDRQYQVIMWMVEAYPETIPKKQLIPFFLQGGHLKYVYDLAGAGCPIHLPYFMSACIAHVESLNFFKWLTTQGIPIQHEWIELAKRFDKHDLVELFHNILSTQQTTQTIQDQVTIQPQHTLSIFSKLAKHFQWRKRNKKNVSTT